MASPLLQQNSVKPCQRMAPARLSETGQLDVTPFPRQDSSLLTPLTKANVLIRLPKESGPWEMGDGIEVLPLGTGAEFSG